MWLGDCLEILPTLPKYDACITDPPYGIGKDGRRGNRKHKHYEFLGWDRERPSKELFDQLINSAQNVVIWGGNYFADLLPPTMRWLVWDKGQRMSQSDGELAWTSMQSALRIFTMNRVELRKDGANHPTQKPVRLMKWCIEQVGHPKSIVDPFMGSGSTGIAAIQMGCSFYGIEKEAKYFDMACARIENAQKQINLFDFQPIGTFKQIEMNEIL